MAENEPVQNVTFASNGGHAHGYLAVPASGTGPGLIVIQEWWGLTTHIADVTDRFALEGFVALAPDLYGGETTHDAEEAGRLMSELPADRAAHDLGGAVDFLLAQPSVVGTSIGAVGFCMGGGFVLSLAAQDPRVSAAVPFYGLPSAPTDFSTMTASVLGNYAADDAFIPREAVEKVAADITAATGTAPDFAFYPAGHAFINDENLLGTYDAEQAKLAWERTLAFLHATLV